MEGKAAASGQQGKDGTSAPTGRFTVIVGKPAIDSACRIEALGRLLRIWSLLQATHEQIADAALPPEGIPRLQRQLQSIRRELESTVPPLLAAELRRITPPGDETPSVTWLRIECATLTSWTGSLTMQLLSTLEAAHRQLARRPSAA